ncbi:glycosyltransferase [Gordonia alkanivorans]|uniref:glycosyltransferase n=1 Tax=Gordonia alkanivorans TaxID=84096 RepID=UPI002448B01C|nr:glycosyltransferase family A protein [Gordonia alkanivorans]MDH3007295.1 glycosyltransferase family A protein [Gordonia alkanivorans]MDH3012758.1 glycosyltransferase family A protein [Gordonia alkanivorans]MDH3016235.1 glycosyltransferase family A protein [Gordonia alkanivorans]MDH3041075.1 glycosyltransferase family A protein [Gordonia alkanivorans]MDH3050360.1 glycosyltransferase family A protein [Gordonia alkanivorans]
MSKISVVVPAFNEEDFIGGCLDRLVAQTRPIDEIIVVDNGSTDATPRIVDRYVDAHPAVTRLVEREPGVMAARRAGFDAATSDIIAKTDADSRVALDWAERIVDFFDSEVGVDHVAITGPVLTWDGPFYDFQKKLQTKTLGPLADGGEIRSLHGPNYALRKSVWHAVKGRLQTSEDVWEDLDLGLALAESEYRMYFDPNVAADASCRQLRHSPVANRSYITGGIRTARGRNNKDALKTMRIDLPVRVSMFTGMWVLFRPWDPSKKNWRPHRLLMPLERERRLVTSRRPHRE